MRPTNLEGRAECIVHGPRPRPRPGPRNWRGAQEISIQELGLGPVDLAWALGPWGWGLFFLLFFPIFSLCVLLFFLPFLLLFFFFLFFFFALKATSRP